MRATWIRWSLSLAAVVWLGAGCSGINTSHSVSPATFLLPGLLKADPPPVESPIPQLNPAQQVAHAQ
jgi:hypothetical protein